MTIGDVLWEKSHIYEIRKAMEPEMQKLTNGVSNFINKYKFYPKVFYNENDINHETLGIRQAIPDLDDYPGIFIHQDAPDTPIDGYKGVEFRSSITKSIRDRTGAKQLLWTVQDLTDKKPLLPSEFCENPSVQFCGTTVFLPNGQPFPQQLPRVNSIYALALSGLNTQINLKVQQFNQGKFIEISGAHLSDDQYWHQMQNHPYGLSVRGWGNWDYRMYELLVSGRIPVHISTDDELLFENMIDWPSFIVIINNLKDIKSSVESFHSQFTDNRSLHNHQRKLIKLYHDYLSFPAFCRHFEDYYSDQLCKWNII